MVWPAAQDKSPLRRFMLGAGTSSCITWACLPRAQHQQTQMPHAALDDDAEQIVNDYVADSPTLALSPEQRDNVIPTMLAGGISGAVSKTCTAPLARLTILYQLHALHHQPPTAGSAGIARVSLLQALKQVVQQEGVKSLWRGNLATIVHRVPYSATNFLVFEKTKAALESVVENDVARRFYAGAAAGLVACSAAYPLDLIRTRLTAQRSVTVTGSGSSSCSATQGAPQQHQACQQQQQQPSGHAPPGASAAAQAASSSEAQAQAHRGPGSGAPSSSSSSSCQHHHTHQHQHHHAAQQQPHPQPSHQPSTHYATQVASHHHQHHHHQQQGGAPGTIRYTPRRLRYTGMQQAFGRIVREEGYSGLYKGLGATLLQATPSLALNFCLYDTIKAGLTLYGQQLDSSSSTSTTTSSTSTGGADSQQQWAGTDVAISLASASLSAFCTSTITFPLDVIRRHMQVHGQGQSKGRMSYWQAVRKVWGRGGGRLSAFYVGIIPEYCKVLPGMAIAFTTYESLKCAMGLEAWGRS